MQMPSHEPAQGTAMIEINDPQIESIPLPFASVVFSDSYHLALLGNFGVDGGIVAFSHPTNSFYVSSAAGLPSTLSTIESEVSSFCNSIEKNLMHANGNVLRIQSILTHLPKMQKLLDEYGYQFLRVYHINDFLASCGYWLMFFKNNESAKFAGEIISRSISSPQFHESITEQIANFFHEEALDETINSWVTLLDKRDKETKEHTKRVADLAVHLALALGLQNEEIQKINRGALLHDVGKIVIPDEILFKPGALTESEWKIMRLHPRIVNDLLRNFSIPDEVLEIPYAHHEKWDGSGYPDGLKGEEIPLSARIFSIVDVWDAMLVDRPYRKKFPRYQVVDYIKEQKDRHFDPRVAEVFLTMVDYIS